MQLQGHFSIFLVSSGAVVNSSAWSVHIPEIMDVNEELLSVVNKMWTKLQDLPKASPLELGAFFVLILFVGQFQLFTLSLE